MDKSYCVYIMTNPKNTVLYTGVTSNLPQRVFQHQSKNVPGFTSKYFVTKLVYFEIFDDPESAISREKQIKGGPRKKKFALVESINPDWNDLSEQL